MSHPAWVCGLKPITWLANTNIAMSHPAWVCGLKLTGSKYTNYFHSHTLRGCVDWNGKQLNQHLILHCHTLRGCVDWNFTLCNLYYWPRVTPCVGVWIETIMHPRQTGQGIVTPCVGVWIETYSEHIANVQKGHTLRGCVDWNWEACAGYIMDVVTPCVGVWIETMTRWIRV